jgi:uncharacterized protein YndB with AHSA1/START domain
VELAFEESVLRTAASPASVWRVWSDPQRWPDWNPDVESMTLDGAFTTGAHATMRTRAGRTHRMQITDVSPPRQFVMETRAAPGMRMRFRCTVDPDGTGARIAQGVEMSGPVGALAARRAAPKIARGFEPILVALAARAEEEEATR